MNAESRTGPPGPGPPELFRELRRRQYASFCAGLNNPHSYSLPLPPFERFPFGYRFCHIEASIYIYVEEGILISLV